MFNLLKKLFKKKEVEIRNVKAKEIIALINKETKRILDETESKLQKILGHIKESIEKTKENIEKLKQAKLQNPNISLREKQFMEGNRQAYIKKIELFLKNIETKGKCFKDMEEFCFSFERLIQNIGKSTIKSRQVLHQFFEHEVSNISRSINSIENEVKKIRELMNQVDLKSVKDAQTSSEKLIKKIKRKKSYKKELEKKKDELENIKKSKNEKLQSIDEFTSSKEFQRLQELKQKKENLKRNLKEKEIVLIHNFAPLEKAMKKYKRIAYEDEAILNRYMQDALKTLIKDKELKVIDLLNKIEKNIKEQQIDLNEKKREKTLKKIKELNKDFFQEFIKQYSEIKKEINDIDEESEKGNTEEKYRNLLDEKENVDKKEFDCKKQIINLENEIKKIKIRKSKRKLESKIKDSLNIDIQIE